MKRKTNSILAGMVLVLTLALTLPVAAQEDVDTSRKCDADAEVVIENICGSITVIGWDKKKAQVRGELGEDVEEFIFEGDADDLEIRVILDERRHGHSFFDFGHGHHNTDNTDLEIYLPHGCSVRIGTVSADVEVTKLTGDLDVETVSGEIDVDGVMKEVELESVSGKLTLEVTALELVASSVSGRVTLRGGSGSVSLESVSGDLELDGKDFDDVEMETVSGEIRLDGDVVSKGSVFVESHSGEIYLLLPKNIEADFDLSTLSGDIDSEFGPSKRRAKKRSFFGGREMSFSTGDGDIRIEAETFSGDIVIEGQ
jgi:DUF4097 and DUF4098 domain-containing protein YvlB